MKLLTKNNDYSLFYDPKAVNRYVVYQTTSASPSGDLKLHTAKAQSSILSKKIKGYFTKSQIDSAMAVLHGMAYTKKFKG